MTLHGAVMVFMVIIPGIPAFLWQFYSSASSWGQDVAFPRLNLMSWYCLIIGASISLFSLVKGGVDTGWTFYTPYSIGEEHAAGGTIWVVLAPL